MSVDLSGDTNKVLAAAKALTASGYALPAVLYRYEDEPEKAIGEWKKVLAY